ncbi:hypothetical protein Q3G72_031734 [Acer saccharum]|nr:hypothetical protein Q3G72_031734 [Acer saccharum]
MLFKSCGFIDIENLINLQFFEHGSPQQRKELADKLVGQMLPLSLQMYYSHTVRYEEHLLLVTSGMDPFIMNQLYGLSNYGNHVKALEVIELDQKTQLVLELDGHVLRRCIADEILESACALAQDQYGNYVTQSMMKDQFANYVIQKILERCSDKQREVLINRIRVHFNALKKYTCGKHIVARFEQLYGEESQGLDASDA